MHTGFQGISHPNKRREECITATGCRLHSSQGLRGIHCQTGYWSRVLVSLSNSGGQRLIHAVETWWQSLSKEILDSSLCWKADGLSILGHGEHPLNRAASPRANNPQWVLLQRSSCLRCRIQPRRQGKWARQVLLSMTMQDHTAINKQHKHWQPSDIPTYHIHHILHIWPHQTHFIQQNNRTNPQEKMPYQWWHGEGCPRLHCRSLKVTTERAAVHRPWWGVCQKCYSVMCRQSSTGGLWPSWVSILYEWPSYLLWCSQHLLCYKHTTVYRRSLFATAQTMFLCLNNNKLQWPQIQWTFNGLKTALFTLTAAGERAHTGFDAKNRCHRNRKLSFRTLLYTVMHMRCVIRATVHRATLCFS